MNLKAKQGNSHKAQKRCFDTLGLRIEGFAETIYCGSEVCLWILRWAVELTSDPPAIALEVFASHVSQAMAKFHPPDSGPFLWPLHDKDIASAIAMCEYVQSDAVWWRRLLWGLRIVQPPGGTVLEECILDHYGREVAAFKSLLGRVLDLFRQVGYVFAWANLFTRSLWVPWTPDLPLSVTMASRPC